MEDGDLSRRKETQPAQLNVVYSKCTYTSKVRPINICSQYTKFYNLHIHVYREHLQNRIRSLFGVGGDWEIMNIRPVHPRTNVLLIISLCWFDFNIIEQYSNMQVHIHQLNVLECTTT